MRSQNHAPDHKRLSYLVLIGVSVIFVAALAVPFHSTASNSAPSAAPSARTPKLPEIISPGSVAPRFYQQFTPPPSSIQVATYASNCTTPKSVFNLQDTDKTVCAKVVNGNANWRILWSRTDHEVVQNVALGAGQNSFTLTGGSSLGDWRVIVYEQFGGDVYAATSFVVVDSGNPKADIAISKNPLDNPVAAGSQAVFSVEVTNIGPSDASTVTITDTVPSGTMFASFALVSGPTGTNCVTPTVGASSGDTVCTIPTLARGEKAVFLSAYDIITGTPAGTEISNTATVTTTTSDPNNQDDSSTGVVTVAGAGTETCTLDCPANVVVTANTTQGGQPGAIVNYGAASVFGSCGAVTNNPASGTFFTVGTHSIVSQSDAGPSCTFTVTVLDTNPPTITCPPDVTVNLASGETQATGVNPGTPTINASGGGTVTGVRSDDDHDPNTPAKPLTDPYPIGTTGINWTVTDAGGRTASCTQQIIVNANCASDTQTPTITAPANILTFTGPGNTACGVILEDLGDYTATDDCSATVTVTGVPSGNAFPVGITTVTYTAKDPSGHTASATQTVEVRDNTPPSIVAPPDASYTCPSEVPAADPSQAIRGTVLDENGNPLPPGPPFDNCGTPTVTVSQSTSGVGSTANPLIITRVFTATDSHGNTASSIQTITVTDGTPPTIAAPANVTAYTGPGATTCDTVVSDTTLGTASAQDNCAGVTVSRSPSGNTFPVGDTTVTWTATDWAGNTATATQTVTVIDNTPPTITLNGQTPSMWPPTHRYHTFNVTDFVASVFDNCGGVAVGNVVIDNVTSDETENGDGDGNTTSDIIIAADCKSVQLRSERNGAGDGRVYTITFRLTDTHGNTSTVTANVVVPHNTGETPVNSGVHYTVNGNCP